MRTKIVINQRDSANQREIRSLIATDKINEVLNECKLEDRQDCGTECEMLEERKTGRERGTGEMGRGTRGRQQGNVGWVVSQIGKHASLYLAKVKST